MSNPHVNMPLCVWHKFCKFMDRQSWDKFSQEQTLDLFVQERTLIVTNGQFALMWFAEHSELPENFIACVVFPLNYLQKIGKLKDKKIKDYQYIQLEFIEHTLSCEVHAMQVHNNEGQVEDTEYFVYAEQVMGKNAADRLIAAEEKAYNKEGAIYCLRFDTYLIDVLQSLFGKENMSLSLTFPLSQAVAMTPVRVVLTEYENMPFVFMFMPWSRPEDAPNGTEYFAALNALVPHLPPLLPPRKK